jgi:hypothetical protein
MKCSENGGEGMLGPSVLLEVRGKEREVLPELEAQQTSVEELLRCWVHCGTQLALASSVIDLA